MTFADGALHCFRSCRCRRRHHRFFCHHHHHHSLSPQYPFRSFTKQLHSAALTAPHARTYTKARTYRAHTLHEFYLPYPHTRCRVPSIIHAVGGAERGAFGFRSSALIPFWHRSFAHRCLVLSSTLAHRAFIFHHLLWVNRRCTNHVLSSSVPSRSSVARIFTRTHISISTQPVSPTHTHIHAYPRIAPYTLPFVWSLERALWIRSLWHRPASSLAHSTLLLSIHRHFKYPDPYCPAPLSISPDVCFPVHAFRPAPGPLPVA